MPRSASVPLSLSCILATAVGLGFAPSSAHAAPPDEGPDASAEGSASVAVDGGGASAKSEGKARTRGNENDRWIDRWAPEPNMFEVGLFGGVIFPHPDLELFQDNPDAPDRGYRRWSPIGPDFGLRFAYMPLRHFGAEAEGAAMPMRVGFGEDGPTNSATMYTARAHLLGQVGNWSITPFGLFGVGVLGVDSNGDAVGSEVDIGLHFGGGLKFFINRYVMLRVDGRGIISNKRGVGDGVIVSPEILVGLSITLGRERDRPRPTFNDADGDGVRDRDDACPEVPGDPPSGCPTVCIPDDDNDKVPNPQDQCPNEPEDRNGFLDDDGCPDEVPEELTSLSGIMQGVNFETDKDTITKDSIPQLEQAAEVLNRFPDLRVEISGHTDSRGGYQHNMDLSRRRAEAVKKWLVDNGVDGSRLETRGAGPDEPIDTNDTSAGRFNNRRIEFTILGGGPVSGDGAKN
ncbi:OmpA domain protein [Plesiocystis pacifica SIR-1]|uniref:OmpA domain protein n=1 Tax=Plesiocystis pacifica SIR-1 TaxID=391625 RepID=A6G559_9BACT|nr:OmpA family protein [Plesiocystis pacifica]EDM78971.1 OmpA domain protein [Plesiocystis pacifica SIR-1]